MIEPLLNGFHRNIQKISVDNVDRGGLHCRGVLIVARQVDALGHQCVPSCSLKTY